MSNAKQTKDMQGYVVSDNTVLTTDMPVWPIHIEDVAKSETKPYPRYKGSARLEGNAEGNLYDTWITKGFQPAVLKVRGVVMKKHDGSFVRFTKDLYLACLVRYSKVGAPQLRIITKDGSEALKAEYVWTREPIRLKGTTPAERRAEVKDLVYSTKPVTEDKPNLDAEIPTVEADPFAA